MITFFDLYQIRPLWKKQNKNDPNLYISLLLGLIGLNHAFTTVLLLFLSSFSKFLLNSVSYNVPTFLFLSSNLIYASLFSILTDLIVFLILVYFPEYFRSSDFLLEWSNLKEELEGEFETKRNLKYFYLKIAFMIFLYGLVAGIYYSLILLIPYFLLYITLNFILASLSSFGNVLIVSIILTWLASILLIIRSKLRLSEIIIDDNSSKEDFVFSDRTFDILASGEEPIVCPGCRSYIPSSSTSCQVCGERL